MEEELLMILLLRLSRRVSLEPEKSISSDVKPISDMAAPWLSESQVCCCLILLV